VGVGINCRTISVPVPDQLALDPRCHAYRLSLRAAGRLLHEQAGRDDAGRRAAAHRDPDEGAEASRLLSTAIYGNGALERPSTGKSRAWRLEAPVSLRQWMREHRYPHVE
jgi:hypothetical protein